MSIIHPDPPMGQEIEHGFYPGFEDGWRRAEVIGRAIMIAFVVACAAGIFGGGLFSERRSANEDDSIRITYEPVVRQGATTVIALDTRVPPGGDKVAVTMAKTLSDQIGLERVTPRPSVWEAGTEGTRMEFPVIAGTDRVLIRFVGSPGFIGQANLWTRLDGGETLAWSQFAVP